MRIAGITRAALAGGVAAVAAAGVLSSGSPALAVGPEVPVFESRTATNTHYLPTLNPQEGAPTFIDPKVAFTVWANPADGLRPIYRVYNPATGQHGLTADANGAGRGVVEGAIGYLAVDAAAARANSTRSCAQPTDVVRGFGPSQVTVYDRSLGATPPGQPAAAGPFFTVAQRSGDVPTFYYGGPVETIGYGPC